MRRTAGYTWTDYKTNTQITNFISAAVILLASLALIVQVSVPYNKTGGPVYFIILFL